MSCPHECEDRAWRGFSLLRALSVIRRVWGPKVSLGSRVRPRILGLRTVGMSVLLILRVRVFEYSEGSGVRIVEELFSGAIFRLFLLQ